MEASKKYPCPAACASQRRQPVSLGDDTHAVGYTAKVCTRARDTHRVWSTVSVGCEPRPSIGARTRTRAEVNVRPRPLVNVNRREDTARLVKTTLWKFTCVDNVTFWKVHGNTQQQHIRKTVS